MLIESARDNVTSAQGDLAAASVAWRGRDWPIMLERIDWAMGRLAQARQKIREATKVGE